MDAHVDLRDAVKFFSTGVTAPFANYVANGAVTHISKTQYSVKTKFINLKVQSPLNPQNHSSMSLPCQDTFPQNS